MNESLSAGVGMIGLLFFFAFFTVMVVWVMRPSVKKRLEEKKYIPLKDEEKENE